MAKTNTITITVLAAVPKPVLTATASSTTVQIPQTLTISGSITDATTGRALPGVKMYLFVDNVQQATGPSDAQGNFSFSNIAFQTPGQYAVDVADNASNQ